MENVPMIQPEGSLSVEAVLGQVMLIQNIMKHAMKDGEHYGTIPGCGDKKVLFKAGAEKLNLTFRYDPEFEYDVIEMRGEHREYRVKCVIISILSGVVQGSGLGSCSTLEKKYLYTTGPKESTGQPVPKAYWDMRNTDPMKALELIGGKGHATAKNKDTGAWEIHVQGEKVENDNPADFYNTCLKMAKKRAMVDAILTVTGASDIFTQDMEEEKETNDEEKKTPKKTPPKQPQAKQPAATNQKQPEQPADQQDTRQPAAPKNPGDAQALDEMYQLFELMKLKEDRRKYYIDRARLLGPSAALDEVNHEHDQQKNNSA